MINTNRDMRRYTELPSLIYMLAHQKITGLRGDRLPNGSTAGCRLSPAIPSS
jgi:hypothetical protein